MNSNNIQMIMALLVHDYVQLSLESIRNVEQIQVLAVL